MNKTELNQMVNGWVNQCASDIRNRINDFTHRMGISCDTLARDLNLDGGRLNRMMRGGTDITVTELATLLIAAGLILEIKPFTAMPNGARGGVPTPPKTNTPRNTPKRDASGRFMRKGAAPMPPMGGMPMPMGGPRTPMPSPLQMGGMPMPPMGGMPMGGYPMPPMSEDGGVNANQTPEVGVANFDSMDRNQLVDEIINNNWDSEIDLVRATREQLISFLEHKTANVSKAANETDAPAEMSASEMGSMIAEQLKNNPEMAAMFRNLMNGCK